MGYFGEAYFEACFEVGLGLVFKYKELTYVVFKSNLARVHFLVSLTD